MTLAGQGKGLPAPPPPPRVNPAPSTTPVKVEVTIAEAAATMTLDDAVRVARSIQRDLEAGKLHTPYPPQVQRALHVCITVFDREGVATKDARAIVERLAAASDPVDTVVPAW